MSVSIVAVGYAVAGESVRRWLRQADINCGDKDWLTSSEQAEMV